MGCVLFLLGVSWCTVCDCLAFIFWRSVDGIIYYVRLVSSCWCGGCVLMVLMDNFWVIGHHTQVPK